MDILDLVVAKPGLLSPIRTGAVFKEAGMVSEKWIDGLMMLANRMQDELAKTKKAILCASESMRPEIEKIAEMINRMNFASKRSRRILKAIYNHNVKRGYTAAKKCDVNRGWE